LAEKPNLVIAAVPTASAAGLYVAQQEGFFRQAGLNVKIVSVGSDATVTPDLLNGSIDVLNGAYPGFIEAQVHGAGKFHILADGYAERRRDRGPAQFGHHLRAAAGRPDDRGERSRQHRGAAGVLDA
jgi:hypothetical protein